MCVHLQIIVTSYELNYVTFTEHQTDGLCLKSGAIYISTAGDAAAAPYQQPSSRDMLWKLALCTAASTRGTCISPSLSQGQISIGALCMSTTCAKA